MIVIMIAYIQVLEITDDIPRYIESSYSREITKVKLGKQSVISFTVSFLVYD